MPTPFFADLVRELAHAGGTGPLPPTGAVPGHRRFADAVPPGAAFHYAIAGIAYPDQWEVGSGQIDGAGRIARDTVLASSNGGARVDFAAGLKTVALTVGAAWFADSAAGAAAQTEAVAAHEAALAALGDTLAGKQPLSTGHAGAATADAADLLTLRRGSDWVNVPMASVAHKAADGRYALGGPLVAAAGNAAAPGIAFSGSGDTGLFLAGSNNIGLAAGGAERARVTAGGALLLGATAPVSTERMLVSADQSGTAFHLVSNLHASGFAGYAMRASGGNWAMRAANNGTLRWDQDFLGAATVRLLVDTGGNFRPGGDNVQTLGAGPARWSIVYSATGTINTSDARDKSWRGAATDAELAAARRIVAELGFFQWNDAIARKGPDGARLHFGVRAQRVWDIMADEGLIDAPGTGATPDSRYAFLCHDGWDAETGGDGALVRPAGDRFGVRSDQLALFLIAAQAAQLAAIEGGA